MMNFCSLSIVYLSFLFIKANMLPLQQMLLRTCHFISPQHINVSLLKGSFPGTLQDRLKVLRELMLW